MPTDQPEATQKLISTIPTQNASEEASRKPEIQAHTQGAHSKAPHRQFKNSHHLILQRKPRSKKRAILLFAQQQQQRALNVEADAKAAAALTPADVDDGDLEVVLSGEISVELVDEEGCEVGDVASIENTILPGSQDQIGASDNASFGDKRAQGDRIEVVPYANHNFGPEETSAISKITTTENSSGLIADINKDVFKNWLKHNSDAESEVPTAPLRQPSRSVPLAEKAPKTVSVTSWDYDLAPFVVENLVLTLERTPSPVMRPVSRVNKEVTPSAMMKPNRHQQQQIMKPFNPQKGPVGQKCPLIAPPQHYPFMRNLNPSIPTLIKHHSDGSQKYVTDAFTLISISNQPVQPLRNIATPLEQRYSHRTSAMEITFPMLPQQSQRVKTPQSPLAPTLPNKSTTTLPKVARKTGAKTPSIASDSLIPIASAFSFQDLPFFSPPPHKNRVQNITKWSSEQDLPIACYEQEALERDPIASPATRDPFFESGEGTAAAPFAAQLSKAASHGKRTKVQKKTNPNHVRPPQSLTPLPAPPFCNPQDNEAQPVLSVKTRPTIPSKRSTDTITELEVNTFSPMMHTVFKDDLSSQHGRRTQLPKLSSHGLSLQPEARLDNMNFLNSTVTGYSKLHLPLLEQAHDLKICYKTSKPSVSPAASMGRPSSSFTTFSKLSYRCASLAASEPQGLLGFDRENELYLEKKRKAERARNYAGRVRLMATLRQARKATPSNDIISQTESGTVYPSASEINVPLKMNSADKNADPALERRRKMLSYAQNIKKPTMSKAAGISMVTDGAPLNAGNKLPKLKNTDSGVDLEQMTEIHERSMKVVESIKREMGLC
ncbi:hypothetical protein BC830DRAFT_1127360 [Chytriomyces sp. MP71]|nr:hypothetical protein BC830DRAFT_1127360 [Chytriomyces sp. MP71]